MVNDMKVIENKKKAKVFFDKQSFIFVKLIKSNGSFELHNGSITELSADFFMLLDYKTQKEIPIFFSELNDPAAIFDLSKVENNKDG